MMKLMQIALVAAIMLAYACIFAQSTELYSDKFDNLDIPGIIRNDKSRNELEDCLFNDRCYREDFKFFKGISFEAYATDCFKCTEKQKENLAFANEWYTKNDPETWQKFEAISYATYKNPAQ